MFRLCFQAANAKEEDLDELLKILDCFFDPEKKPVQPKTIFYQNNNYKPRPRKMRRKKIDKNMNQEENTDKNIENDKNMVNEIEVEC